MLLTIVIVVCVTAAIIWILDRTSWQTPILFYKRTPFTDYIVKAVPRLSSPYKSTFYLSLNRHLHTAAATYFTYFNKMHSSRQHLKLQDGGVVAIDWPKPDMLDNDDKDDRPIIILCLGMEGCIKLAYHIACGASKRGFRTAVFNKRGHGGTHLLTPKLQSFGDPTDFKQVVEYVHQTYPHSKLLGLSYSAGGGPLMSYLGAEGDRSLITATVHVSAGFNPLEQSRTLHWLYESIMVKGLKQIVQQHSHVVSSHIDMDKVLRCKSLPEFDENVYCKFYNHSTLEEYWDHNDPLRNQANVRSPALFLNSVDDPVLFEHFIPYDMIKEHPDWMLARVNKGGHCGFREGLSAAPWAECVALDYFKAVLKYEPK
ncbi:phospholipase ABHD3-like [Gigantopelta aegis]|uniref:phospholipase ABHD3-like n=1 Tax=Gigantopelta aegis TaxID=1735272 RepID=UPI001B889737|nr:phospholipase ABHD3-like [Gigantopelta aegis]XP_041348164.1 phospholipase ABHD3-like [Gigantopelta aegis]XP_041348165.1 phospholipase ABHD3-like [Gigantopelta aegis]XP_041348166.1 phospholipase ABHD3-like [Gigantopelta aegis]XP_041348167.1 phospholipase ABHD3-like [Gigantopelta aegis]